MTPGSKHGACEPATQGTNVLGSHLSGPSRGELGSWDGRGVEILWSFPRSACDRDPKPRLLPGWTRPSEGRPASRRGSGLRTASGRPSLTPLPPASPSPRPSPLSRPVRVRLLVTPSWATQTAQSSETGWAFGGLDPGPLWRLSTCFLPPPRLCPPRGRPDPDLGPGRRQAGVCREKREGMALRAAAVSERWFGGKGGHGEWGAQGSCGDTSVNREG